MCFAVPSSLWRSDGLSALGRRRSAIAPSLRRETSACAGAILHPRADKVLNYWLGSTDERSQRNYPFDARFSKWFGGGPAVDAEIRDLFGDDLEKLNDGQTLAPWDGSDERLETFLAKVILMDQFSRNVYRGTPKMFALDPHARSLTKRCLADPGYTHLYPCYKMFFLVNLMHSEDAADHHICKSEYSKEAARLEAQEDMGPTLKAWNQSSQFADVHREEIERFGRYPHRNAILGRQSTSEEALYLKTSTQGYHK